MTTPTTFSLALKNARRSIRVSQSEIAAHFAIGPNSVSRWERGSTMPSYEDRMKLLRYLANAPRPLLEVLAGESGVPLESVGLARPVAPPPSPALPPGTQAIVDDALREAAEEAEVSPKLLRPALSRMLDRLARAGVPIDAAARMVLRIPKREAGEGKKAAEG